MKKRGKEKSQVTKCKWSQWGLNPQPFTHQSCMLSWLYQEHITPRGWKTKIVFIDNNEDSIIHVTQWSKHPLHIFGWVRVDYVKKSPFFITGSSNRTLCIQKCHSNIDYVKKEFKMPTLWEGLDFVSKAKYKSLQISLFWSTTLLKVSNMSTKYHP